MEKGDLNDLLILVSESTGIPTADFCSTSRRQPIVDARHIFFSLARQMFSDRYSLQEIGSFLRKDHATVLHSMKRCEDLIFSDPKFKFRYETIKNRARQILTVHRDYNFIPQL